MLSDLPTRLKVEIQCWRYSHIFKLSNFFKNPNSRSSDELISSIMRFVEYEVIMPEEIIILAGNILFK